MRFESQRSNTDRHQIRPKRWWAQTKIHRDVLLRRVWRGFSSKRRWNMPCVDRPKRGGQGCDLAELSERFPFRVSDKEEWRSNGSHASDERSDLRPAS